MDTIREQELRKALSERERAILCLMADGLSNQEIADRLFLALTTVKWYIRQINDKLDTHTRTQTVARAHQLKLVGDSDAVRVRLAEAHEAPENPYKGLRAFQEADAADFYGREALVQRLLTRLSEAEGEAHFLAVVGPSGSGKSSVVRAGLIPALRCGGSPGSERWWIAEMLPGTHPLEELEIVLLRLAANPPPSLLPQLREDERGLLRATRRVLPNDESVLALVIDQFEEVFTLVEDQAERQHFLDSLSAAVMDARSPLRVIVTLRADFYDRPLLYAGFGELIRQRTEVVLPLTADELEQAITRPAARVGVAVEAGLVAAMVAEANQQPGVLPLLEYALTELFDYGQGATLTLDGYRAIGGVLRALARRADALFEALDARGQEAARQLFLRLVTLGEGVEDTRRRVLQSELLAVGHGVGAHGRAPLPATENNLMDDIIQTFAAYRLLTLDRDPATRTPTVELAHEAIIREWGQLRGWLDESRADVRMQRLLANATTEWHNAGRDISFLLAGSRLAQFEEWAAETGLALTGDEFAYLQESIAERKRQAEIERDRQAHEKWLERRSRTFLRALVMVFALAAVLSGGLAFTANNQRTRAEAAEEDALRQASIGLAAQSQFELVNGLPERATLLAVEALEAYPYTWQAESALFAAVTENRLLHILEGHSHIVEGFSWSPDGDRLLTPSRDGTASIWDVETGERLWVLSIYSGAPVNSAWSPDGSQAATAAADGKVIVWNANTGAAVFTLTHSASAISVHWSPDGARIATTGGDGATRIWDAQTGERIASLHNSAGGRADWSPDGTRLATTSLTSEAGDTRIWDAATFEELFAVPGQANPWNVSSVWSPDGTRLYTIDDTANEAMIWDAETGEKLFDLPGEGRGVISTGAFSPDGLRFLTVEAGNNSVDGVATIWDTTTGERIYRLPGSGDMYEGVWSPDGTRVAVNDEAFETRIWDAVNGSELFRVRGIGSLLPVIWSPDGTCLATGYVNGSVLLWDMTDPALFAFPGQTSTVAGWSPDGRYFLRADQGGSLIISDTETGQPVKSFAPVARGYGWADWSPDGQFLATSHPDRTVHIWDIASGEERLIFEIFPVPPVLNAPPSPYDLRWSPDGTRIVLSDFDGGESYVFDASTGERLLTLSGGVWCAPDWSPDGTRLTTGRGTLGFGAGSLVVWDAATGEETLTLPTETFTCGVHWSPDGTRLVVPLLFNKRNPSYIVDAETGEVLLTYSRHIGMANGGWWSPDGARVVTTGDDATRIWDPVTGGEHGVLDTVSWIAEFSPDNARLLTIGKDSVLRIWRIFPDTDSLIAYAHECCVLRALTLEERQQFGLPEY